MSSRILAVLSHARRWTGGRDRGNGKTGGAMRGSEWNGERNLLFYLVPTTKIQAATLSLFIITIIHTQGQSTHDLLIFYVLPWELSF